MVQRGRAVLSPIHTKNGKARRKRKGPYTKGHLNQIVDSVVHPLVEEDPKWIIIDGILHSIVEQNPEESMLKFIKFGLPELLKAVLKMKRR